MNENPDWLFWFSVRFIIELCEPVQVKQLDIANFELFSSTPKDFLVSISDRWVLYFPDMFILRDDMQYTPPYHWTTSVLGQISNQQVAEAGHFSRQGWAHSPELPFRWTPLCQICEGEHICIKLSSLAPILHWTCLCFVLKYSRNISFLQHQTVVSYFYPESSFWPVLPTVKSF